MENVIFSLRDICYSYLGKYPALQGVSISIERGQKIAVVGANGSGKSTLLHLLDALIFPDKGVIAAFGSEVTEDALGDREFSRNFRRRVGLVFQNPDIQLFCPTVKEDILFGPLQLGIERRVIDTRFERLMTILGIKDLLERSPHQLSVGEKRKVAIASTLIMEPEVIILDEPTAGLDPLTTRHIIDLLVEENRLGKTIITSTHDLHIVEEIADIVHVFGHKKEIVASGAADAILKDTALLEANNLVHIHAHNHKGSIHVHPHEHPSHEHTHPSGH